MRGFRRFIFGRGALGLAAAAAMVCGSASAAETRPMLPADLAGITFDRDAASRVRLASDFSSSAAVILPAPNYGPPLARVITSKEASLNVPVGSAVTLDLVYNADMGARAGIYDARAVKGADGLFFSGGALNSPYATVMNGATYAGFTVRLSDTVDLRFGAASLSPGRNTHLNDPVSTLLALDGNMPVYETRRGDAMMAGLNWDFASWGGLGVVAMQSSEHANQTTGFAFTNDSADTQSIGLSAHLGLGDGWVTTASFSTGVSEIDSRYALQFGETTQHTRAYGLAIAKHGLFGTDSSLGLSVSRPLLNNWALGTANPSRPAFFGRANLLENNIQETDIEVGYVTSFMDGALALQTNAAYQVNGGRNGNDTVSMISRAKIKF